MMSNILFVDDDQGVLDGLRRMLRSQRKEWKMFFTDSGEHALDVVDNNDIDIVVSDVRMPGMNGVELLAKVKSEHPDIIRLALSGYADTELQLESAKVLHQFIAKPVNADNLKLIINRALALRELLKSEALLAVVTEASTLPSLPELYEKVVAEAASPDGTLIGIGEIISQDPAMSAKILQLVNSAFFGLPRQVSSVEEAATILGIDVIRSLVISVKVFEEFASLQSAGVDIEAIIRHSQGTAVLAKALARHEGLDRKEADLAFMAGMLHEVGKLLLASALPEQYAQVTALENNGSPDWAAETEVFGTTHSEVGAYLLGIWSLPNSIVEAVAYHHNDHALDHQPFSVTSAVYIASTLNLGEPLKTHDMISKEKLAEWQALADSPD